MSVVGSALAAGIRAPVKRLPLAFALWVGRLLPILFLFTLPLYDAASGAAGAHPDSPRLLDPSKDASGFAHAFFTDLVREHLLGVEERVLWAVALGWIVTVFLSGGITARLLGGDGLFGSFFGKCGRYAARIFRLALFSLLLLYALDVGINVLWAESVIAQRFLQHTEAWRTKQEWLRGGIFVAGATLLGFIHAYARIDLVLHDRRSALLSWFRGLGLLLRHLHRLFVVEVAMLLVGGAGVAAAWATRFGVNAQTGAGSLAFFLALTGLASLLRTGIEVGAMEARCRIFNPPPAPQG